MKKARRPSSEPEDAPMLYRALFLILANLVVVALLPVAATLALASQAMGG